MKFYPSKNRLLVKRTEAEKVSPGGIALPDSAAERPYQGEVIATGGKVAWPVGVTVLFGKYSGSAVEIEGEEYLILMREDVLGALES